MVFLSAVIQHELTFRRFSVCSCRQTFYCKTSRLSCRWCIVYETIYLMTLYLLTVSAAKHAFIPLLLPRPDLTFSLFLPSVVLEVAVCCLGYVKNKIDRSEQKPIKIFRKSSRGRIHGLSKIFRAPIHKAHRAVIFAVARLSCFVILQYITYQTR